MAIGCFANGRVRQAQREKKKKKKNEQLGTKKNLLVRTVDVVNGQNGQVAVVTEVAQSDTGTSLQLVVVDGLLADVESDGHREHVAVGKAAILADAVI